MDMKKVSLPSANFNSGSMEPDNVIIDIDNSHFDLQKSNQRLSCLDFQFKDPSIEVHLDEPEDSPFASSVTIFEVSLNNDYETLDNEESEDIYMKSGEPADVKSRDLCRLCGKSSDVKIGIFSAEGARANLLGKIHRHLPVLVTEDDKLPHHVCDVCSNHLEICHELVESSQEAERRLQDMLSKEEDEEENRKISSGLECLNNPESLASTSADLSDVPEQKLKVQDKSIKVVVVRLNGSDTSMKNEPTELENTSESQPQFLCTLCNSNLHGTDMVVRHQKEVHSLEVLVCQWCKEFFDSRSQLESHQLEKHLRDSMKVVNVAEIQVMKEGSLKMSKEFDQMEKSLQSKIVDAIQSMVGQQLPDKEKQPINCSVCKKAFGSLALLQEHRLKAHEELKCFTCNYCQNHFLTKRMLLRHITEHSEYKAFRCPECHKGYNTKVGYTIHMSTHNPEKPFICPECGKGFKHNSNLKAHQKSHLPDDQKKRFKCPQCEKKFRCQFLVDEHMRTHTGERPFSCEVCSKTFHRKQQLAQHLLVHRTDLTFECHLCGSRFNRKGNLTEHMKKHVSKNKYICKVCKESFDSLSDVIAHRRGHSNEELAQVKTTKKITETCFKCEFCEKVLAAKTSLKAHLRIHTGEKPFECDICGKKFSQKPALSYHKKLHSSEKPFQCSYCTEGFVTRTARAVHERIHTNEKPYSCQYCSASFRGANSLSQHLLLHSDERPFKCTHCTRAFRRKEALQIHERIHTGQRPYSCDICGRAFTQRGDLSKHKKTHANNSRLHSCKSCDFSCKNRKTMKKHETIHTTEGNIIAESLISSFSEVQDCEMILDGSVIEVEHIQL